MDTYDLVSKHPLLAILRNVPLEKTIDYAEAAVPFVGANCQAGAVLHLAAEQPTETLVRQKTQAENKNGDEKNTQNTHETLLFLRP